MLRRLREAGLVWPTLATVGALAVLLSLGTWQVQRKQWKDGLIATIAARAQAEPVELKPGKAIVAEGSPQYLHVAIAGRFHHDKERYLYAPAPGGLGWHVYTPLEVAPDRFVWINRGFVPDARKDPASRKEGLIPGEVRVTGLVREVPAPGMFTPANDPGRNLWYWPDIAAMASSAFTGGHLERLAFPYFIDADARPEPPGGLPKGGVTRLELSNRHLEYAITWYGLALTLIGVYSAFVAARLGFWRG